MFNALDGGTQSGILFKNPIAKFLEGSGSVRSLFDFTARFETSREMKIHESLLLHNWIYATRHRMRFPMSEAG
jgi:hypothetical protein